MQCKASFECAEKRYVKSVYLSLHHESKSPEARDVLCPFKTLTLIAELRVHLEYIEIPHNSMTCFVSYFTGKVFAIMLCLANYINKIPCTF